MKNLEKTVTMICPNCGNTLFENITNEDSFSESDEESCFKCSDCKMVFTKASLIEENKDNIEQVQEELIEDLLSDFHKEMGKIFGKGNVKWK